MKKHWLRSALWVALISLLQDSPYMLQAAEVLEMQENLHSKDVPEDEGEDLILIDKGEYLVAGPIQQTVICKSELERPSVDGRKNTPDQLINQELAYQEVVRMKMPIEDAAQKHIQGMKKEHGLTDAQIDAIFQQAGRTREEGLQELTRIYAANNLHDMKINSRIVIPHEEIEQYYQENPEYDAAEYYVQTALVFAEPNKNLVQQKKDLQEQIVRNKGADLSWREPVWLKEDEIADERLFITTMEAGQISDVLDSYGGFEVLKVLQTKEPTLIPLERRYKNIMMTLRQPKAEFLQQEHERELRSNACIIKLEN